MEEKDMDGSGIDSVRAPYDKKLNVIFEELLRQRQLVEDINKRLSDIEKTLNKPAKSTTQESKNSKYISITPSQRKILLYLKKEGPKTQSEIIQTLKMAQPSVSYSLAKLEKELNIVESKPTLKPGARLEYSLKKELSKEVLDSLFQLDKLYRNSSTNTGEKRATK
jgi:DNA-binding MarR family transcriptional regulator